VGELQIITRASYAMLVIVPLLAGTWPVVREVINDYNRATERTTAALEEQTRNFSREVRSGAELLRTGLVAPELQDQLGRVASRLDAVANQVQAELAELRRRTVVSPDLPNTWAVAFFAALAVFLGHTLYQIGAPEIVRRETLQQYAVRSRDEFAKHPTPEALHYARTEAERGEYEEVQRLVNSVAQSYSRRHNPGTDGTEETENLLKPARRTIRSLTPGARNMLVTALQEKISSLPHTMVNIRDIVRSIMANPALPRAADTTAADVVSPEDMSTVERAARVQYYEASLEWAPLFVLSLVYYMVAVALILMIVWQQASAVAEAAGWTWWPSSGSPW
jgi:hypothetical protein